MLNELEGHALHICLARTCALPRRSPGPLAPALLQLDAPTRAQQQQQQPKSVAKVLCARVYKHAHNVMFSINHWLGGRASMHARV